MVLPKAPPAGAPAAPSLALCGLCGEEAKETESDLVELFCNQGECVDAAGRRYHRDCLTDHIAKTGRVRKTHGGIADLRQIQHMELSGFHCVHSHSGACPKGRIKGSLLILQVKKKAKAFGGGSAADAPAPAPKAAPPKLPSVPRKAVRGGTFATASHDASRPRPAPAAEVAAQQGSALRNGPPPGAEFADVDVDAENRRRAAKAARAVASKDAKAAARPLGSSNTGGADAEHPAAVKSPWWEQIQRMDDAYEPKGFNNLVVPTGFTVPERNPWAQPPASGPQAEGVAVASHGTASPHGGLSNGGSPHGSNEHYQSRPLNEAELAYLYAGPVQVPDGRDPDALFAQLLEMGYSEEDSHEVAFRCSTIEAAVEAINNKTDPAFLAELDSQYQAALAFQERAAQARKGALPPVQSAASLAADAAAAAAFYAADNGHGVPQNADDGWKTFKTRASKPAGPAGPGAKGHAPLTLPKDAGAVLLGLYRSKKLRLADVPLPVLNALAQAPDGVAYECMRSLEESLRRGNTIRNAGSWLLNAVRILTEQYRMCSLSDDEDDDDSWSDTGSRCGSSPAGSTFGGSSFSGSHSSSRPRQAPPPAQPAWQAPRTAQHAAFAAFAATQEPPVSRAPAPAPTHWPTLQPTATPALYPYSQHHLSVSAAHGAYAQPVAQAPPTPQPVYAAYSTPQPATAADDDLAFILNQLDVR